MVFLDPQEAEKINKQKYKQFWWTPCIVAYFQNQRSKTKKITKPIEIFGIDISKCFNFSKNMEYFLALIVDSSTKYYQKVLTRLQMITLYIIRLYILQEQKICVTNLFKCYALHATFKTANYFI